MAVQWLSQVTGNIIAAGATDVNNYNGGCGRVGVFEWDAASTHWIQRGSSSNVNPNGDQTGILLALSDDGNTVAATAVGHDGNHGQVEYFEWVPNEGQLDET